MGLKFPNQELDFPQSNETQHNTNGTGTMLQAPKGGTICPLNNEFYEGGQFLPEIGLPKGSNRKVKIIAAEKTAFSWNMAEIAVYRNVLIRNGKTHGVRYRMVGEDRMRYAKVDGTKEECVKFVEAVLSERAKMYAEAGFRNHPTLVKIED